MRSPLLLAALLLGAACLGCGPKPVLMDNAGMGYMRNIKPADKDPPTLIIAPSVPTEFEVAAPDGFAPVRVENWHRILKEGFAHVIGDNPSSDHRFELTDTKLTLEPHSPGFMKAVLTFKVRLLNKEGRELKIRERTVESPKMTLRDGGPNSIRATILAMSREMVNRLLGWELKE